MTPDERAHEIVQRRIMEPGSSADDIKADIAAAIRAAETVAVLANKRIMQELCERAIADIKQRCGERGET